MNIENILYQANKKLKSANIKSASIDCEVLLSNIIKKDRKFIILNPKKKIRSYYLNFFNKLIEKRKNGEPVAYLINKKEFWNETFFINKNVLIPRPDTEHLIESVLKYTKKKARMHILDIGTGSGCILLSVLKERKNFRGTGIDVSKECINVSKYNTKVLNLKNRTKFYNCDVDKFLIGKYDVIVSNPPYIKSFDLKYLERDVMGFEPHLALDGGCDGLYKIIKVINKASALIKRNGIFILEIGHEQKNKIVEILRAKGFYIKEKIKDYGKKYRCIVATKI